MRRLLRRKAVTIIAAIVSFTAIPAAGIVATATPALASVYICNSSGLFCVGDPAPVNNGDPVVLTVGGRAITRVDTFLQFNTWEVFQLQFDANPSQCVGVQNSTSNVTVRNCSGGQNSNTYWAKDVQRDGSVKWVSTTKNGLLASDNTQGHQLFVTVGCSGCFIRWDN